MTKKTHHIDIRFPTRVSKTPRVLEVAEAFGIGLADSEFVVFDNLDIKVGQGEVIYITGQSGSGKSLLLRELARQLSETKTVARLDDVELDPDLPIIEQVGKTFSEGLQFLGRAGVSDAYLYVRKPGELSDGQRYRVKLAILLANGWDVWVADEFGAVLDRETAKVVAFNMSRAARAAGATLIVATTHTDLAADLNPSITVTKHYRERLKVEVNDAV